MVKDQEEYSNVIEFPLEHVARERLNYRDTESLDNAIRAKKEAYISVVVNQEIKILFDRLQAYHGMSTANPETVKDLGLVATAIQSMLNRAYDLPHQMHAAADRITPEEQDLIVSSLGEGDSDDPEPLRFA